MVLAPVEQCVAAAVFTNGRRLGADTNRARSMIMCHSVCVCDTSKVKAADVPLYY